MSDDPHDPAFGRRTYDVEIARLQFQVLALQKENAELRLETAEELKALRGDIKELLEAWKSAKGVSTFVKWAASIVAAVALLVAASKGLKL